MTLPILFTFDQSLEMPAGVCITSLLENAAPDTFYDIFILHGPGCDFSESKLNELARTTPTAASASAKWKGSSWADTKSGAYPKRPTTAS